MSRLVCLSRQIAAVGVQPSAPASAQDGWLLVPDRLFDGGDRNNGER